MPEGTVIGHEFAGEVVAVGPGMSPDFIGDRMTSLGVDSCGQCGSCLSGDPLWCAHGRMGLIGGAGQYVSVKAHASVRLPSGLSVTDGALLEPLACALHAVKLSGLSAGGRALILGGGAIGLATAFWARQLGATRVVVASRSRRNECLATSLGATSFLTTATLCEALGDALRGAPDVVFECAGAAKLVTLAIELVRPRGTIIIAGGCAPSDIFQPMALLFKELRIQGSYGFNLQELRTVADVLAEEATELRRMITHTVSLAELPKTFEALRNPTDQCKVMIDPWA